MREKPRLKTADAPANARSCAKAVLVLEDGSVFEGKAYGAVGSTLGEIVFTTGMTGYQETLTDPSYAGQIVLMTAPHIGNTGVNTEDMESRKIWVEGFIVRDPARRYSNFRAEKSLDEELQDDGVVGISAVDTRAITRIIRASGAMRAGIFSGDALGSKTHEELLAEVKAQSAMAGKSLSAEVTTPEAYKVDADPDTEYTGSVAVLDLGIKTATVNYLAAHGFDVHVLPAHTSAAEIKELGADALFFSNGPGDPAASAAQVETLQEALKAGMPYFGICFGNQLLGRALGFGTYKLPFGHRGINQPVADTRTGKVSITAQNHGFAVDLKPGEEHESPAGFGRVRVSHISLNDNVVEGLECLDIPAFSVQYHPEAAAGPHDSFYLFDQFREVVKQHRAQRCDSNSADNSANCTENAENPTAKETANA